LKHSITDSYSCTFLDKIKNGVPSNVIIDQIRDKNCETVYIDNKQNDLRIERVYTACV